MTPAGTGLRSLGTPDGATIAYRFRPGPEPWVLLHGLGCDAAMWDGVVAALPPGAGLLVPDLRGHGRSTLGWRSPSVDLWAEDVRRLVEAERLEAPLVAGLSMGGYTALAVAEAAPGLARAWGLVSTSAAPDDDAARLRRAAGLATLRFRGWRAYADELVPRLLAEGGPRREALGRELVEAFGRAGDSGLAATLFALASRPDRRALLSRMREPAAVVAGDLDAIIPVDRARETAAALPRGRLTIVPGAGHMSALEAPSGVARALLLADEESRR